MSNPRRRLSSDELNFIVDNAIRDNISQTALLMRLRSERLMCGDLRLRRVWRERGGKLVGVNGHTVRRDSHPLERI